MTIRDLMPPKAIGLLQLDVTGADRQRDEQTIINLARQYGYVFAGFLTIRDDTYMPITLLVDTAAKVAAVAIVAPDLAHFGGHARAVAVACELITPAGKVLRSGHDRAVNQ